MSKIQSGALLDGFTMDGIPKPSGDLVPVARGIAGNRLLLSFSGRDSLAAWIFLRDAGFEIIPYWLYTVPGLSYDVEMLDYYQRYFGTHIIRLPHPYLFDLYKWGAWQPLENWRVLVKSKLPTFRYADIEKVLAVQFGLGDNYLSAVGIKAADNLMRHRLIYQMGPIGLRKRHYYYAVWDWKTADIKECLAKNDVKLSKSYLIFGVTGDLLHYNVIKTMKEKSPEDYKKVLEVFPMIDIELFRYECVA